MGLDDIIVKETNELAKPTENELKKNNESINKYDSNISDKGNISDAKLDNSDSNDSTNNTGNEKDEKKNDLNLEPNRSLDLTDTINTKGTNLRNQEEELKVIEDNKQNVSDEDSEGSFTDYTSTEVEDDSDTSDGQDGSDESSTDSELYAKNILEENSVEEELDLTDTECTSLSDQESIKTDSDYAYDELSSVEKEVKNTDAEYRSTGEDDEQSNSSKQKFEINMEVCQDEDPELIKPDEDFAYGEHSTTEEENNSSKQELEINMEISSDEDLGSIKSDEDIMYEDQSSIEKELKSTDEESCSTEEQDVENNSSKQELEINMEISSDEDLGSIKSDEDIMYEDQSSIEKELKSTDEESRSTEEQDVEYNCSKQEYKSFKSDEVFQREEKNSIDEEEFDDTDGEYSSIDSKTDLNNYMSLSQEEDIINKLIDELTESIDFDSSIINDMITDIELDQIDAYLKEDQTRNNDNEFPVFTEFELEIISKFWQSDDELDNIVQEALNNQLYEYED